MIITQNGITLFTVYEPAYFFGGVALLLVMLYAAITYR